MHLKRDEQYKYDSINEKLDEVNCTVNSINMYINPLNTKRRLLYLKSQFVPRSKHFSSQLQKPIS